MIVRVPTRTCRMMDIGYVKENLSECSIGAAQSVWLKGRDFLSARYFVKNIFKFLIAVC